MSGTAAGGSGGSSFNPARFAVGRWQFTLLVFAMLVFLGLQTLTTVSRTEDPQFPIPVMQVVAALPGADPVDVEQLLVKPIEDAIDGLDGIKEVRSFSGNGFGIVTVEFGWDETPDRKYDEVVREVNALRPSLPSGVAKVEVKRFRTTEASVRQIALVSKDLPWRRLEKIADNLRERIDRVPGVRDTRYWGAPESELRVAVDLGRLAELNVPVTIVADAIRNAGQDLPIGAVHAGERRFNVKAQGAFKSLDQVRDVPVLAREGRVLKVKDVADVRWNTAEPTHLMRYNGARAMFVSATQKDGVDAIRLTRKIDAAVADFEKTLPANVTIEKGFAQADNVERRLSSLYTDFAIAIGLVMLTLLPLGLRAGFIVMISIPLSLLIAVFALYQLGFTVNQLSIAGFVLSLGLLVDDSIVVVENIARHLREGKTRLQAAVDATGQISVAILGCTATLMLAFLPLMFLPEGSGQFIRSLPVSVLLAVGASLIVALTIIPFLASRILSEHEAPEGNRMLQAINGTIHKVYRPALHWALTHPRRTFMIILLLCLTAFPVLKIIGSSLFPPAGTPQFLVRIVAPDGTSLKSTDAILRKVEAEIARHEDVKWYFSNLGRGNPRIYYNIIQQETNAGYAELFVELKEWQGKRSFALLDGMRQKFRSIPGAEIKIIVFENGPPINAPIEVRIAGEDLRVLKQLAAEAEKILLATPGTQDVINPLRVDRTDLNLGLDDAKAAVLGVSAGAPKRIARLALSGETAAQYRDPDGDDYPVRIRLPMDVRNDISAMNQIYVPTTAGGALPLQLIATPQLESSPAQIERYQRLRQVGLTSYVKTGYLTSKVNADVEAKIRQALSVPPGYKVSLGGQAEKQAESFSGMSTAVLVAVFGILTVLILEFGKFKTVLVVAGIIPLGFFGAVIALWITGNALSFTAAIGIIALIGIEVKNSILLVDFTEQLRREGVPLRDAIEKAGEIRFLPVLLTSATAIGGLLPLALEDSGLFSPMAIAIIGGLVTSTLLSRIATPVMYLLVVRE
jgi:multidrug efflux pump subunit AcrB